MAYTRTNWIPEETPLNAANMNNIENGIEEMQIDDAVKALAQSMGWVDEES